MSLVDDDGELRVLSGAIERAVRVLRRGDGGGGEKL
jgi:hypothetical protein